MPRYLQATTERFAVAGSFTISRGTRTHADVVTCTIRDGSFTGIGECVPYPRYGESIEGVTADIEAMADRVAAGLTRQELQQVMKPGAARNAVDCALWDLEAKMSGKRAAEQVLGQPAQPLVTAYTISLADPDTMAAKTAENAGRPLLKIKTGTADDEARLRAVRAAAPEARIIIDANEGWNDDNIEYYLKLACGGTEDIADRTAPARRQGCHARPHRTPGSDLRR